jgi:hypothetical protein
MDSRRLRLRVETPRHIVEGILQLPTEGYRSRTTDYLNAHDSDFVALTEASVLQIDGGKAVEHEYVAVNLRHAVLVVELERLADEPPMAAVATLPGAEAAGTPVAPAPAPAAPAPAAPAPAPVAPAPAAPAPAPPPAAPAPAPPTSAPPPGVA